MIQLGQHVRDSVTGFQGVVTGRAEYLFEATTCRIHKTELTTDGKPYDPLWFEEARLEIVDAEAKPRIGYITVVGEKQRGVQNCDGYAAGWLPGGGQVKCTLHLGHEGPHRAFLEDQKQ